MRLGIALVIGVLCYPVFWALGFLFGIAQSSFKEGYDMGKETMEKPQDEWR